MIRFPDHLGAATGPDGSTRFVLWAPLQPRVHIQFPDSGRREAMRPTDDGYHALTTAAPAGTRYCYELSDGTLRPDPASRAQPEGVHGPSMVVERPRIAGGFESRPLEDHVIYELHVGTYTPEGTFDAIIPHVDELRRLGVTAIELMPVAQFPGARNWGYDGVLPFAVQWSYGGVAGLCRLVEACHQRGLACLLDVVYNHLGPEGNYLADFGPYFSDRYKTPWGAALNFDGRESDHVREYFIQSSLYFTRDCGLDGLRLDAVHAMIDHTAIPFVRNLAARQHEVAVQQGRRIHIIAESCDNDPRLLRDPAVGGMGCDACWNDDFHHAVRSAITGEQRGYYAWYGRPEQVAACVRDRFVFTGQYSKAFGRRHGAPASDVPRGRLVAFTQNHDQVGNRPLGDRLHEEAGLNGARVFAALALLGPFTPMLWMGEEYAETSPFLYFVSHGDPALIEAVRAGRASEFADFQSAQPVPDPQSEETFLRSKLTWELRDKPPHSLMLAYYAELLRLRRRLEIPRLASQARCEAVGPLIALWYGEQSPVLVLANTSRSAATVLPGRLCEMPREPAVVLNSEDRAWGGGGSGARSRVAGDEWFVPGLAALLLAPADLP